MDRRSRAAQGPAGGESPAQTVLNTKPLFKLMVEKKASDLFFTANAPIKIKIEGQIFPVNKNVLTPEVVRQTALGLMSQEQRERFQARTGDRFRHLRAPAWAAFASTFSCSAAIRPWCCAISRRTCRAWSR